MFDYTVGDSAALQRSFSRDDLADYAGLVGGAPLDEVPPALVGGLFSRLLGTELPGRGTNWMKQRLTFHAQARVGELLTASVEIVRLRPDKSLVNLRTRCIGTRGRIICDGEALVMAREMEAAG
jgi:3-hydroxybutyryl-CoA dehydratase